ncbi:winged helix-turn-helix domain-containing protein [Pseudofrankia inefficax]|uniref:Putative two component transcriptional regulator, winged helix family n=1 Tax=Pseudofrankia inefficax (strain DSM 45817 / CECT 9037 / DDB 130130 / EuI1c) TaxID=298654 RepID=E3IYI3_PSEI1|nr:winged helix-turn-helix domain-containing protein [Pseudofrankia inefficax]ADP85054.1 putative two component transcriptional regulator, winged helix family [Pseudofrankia inefficax]
MSPQPATVRAASEQLAATRSLAPVAPVRRLSGPASPATQVAQPARGPLSRPVGVARPGERFDLRQFNRAPLVAGAPGGATATSAYAAPITSSRAGLAVDRSAWAAWLDGELLNLTYLEFEVLDFLVRHPGRVYSRAALLRHVWGHRVDDDPGQAGRTVDVLVTRLRRKLGPDNRSRIETVRRVGYRYRPAAVDTVA